MITVTLFSPAYWSQASYFNNHYYKSCIKAFYFFGHHYEDGYEDVGGNSTGLRLAKL